VKYLLLICGEESAAAHSGDGCGGWLAEMAGFCVIECADMAAAVEAAARHPAAGYGTIEIRPMLPS
jgi:hypothetical protein